LKDLNDIPTENLNATQKEFLGMLLSVGWTMAKAARELKVTPSAITQYLNGGNTPPASMMELARLKTKPVEYPKKEEMVAVGVVTDRLEERRQEDHLLADRMSRQIEKIRTAIKALDEDLALLKTPGPATRREDYKKGRV
jgi:transcriptional regulator with XRE-family HTH domain